MLILHSRVHRFCLISPNVSHDTFRFASRTHCLAQLSSYDLLDDLSGIVLTDIAVKGISNLLAAVTQCPSCGLSGVP